MNHVEGMLKTHPHQQTSLFERDALLECLKACHDCALACTSCADACLGEPGVQQLVRCIRLNLDCADVCESTGRLLGRMTEPDAGVLRAQLQACIEACRACGAECQKHAGHHEHCRVCADACHACTRACERLVGSA